MHSVFFVWAPGPKMLPMWVLHLALTATHAQGDSEDTLRSFHVLRVFVVEDKLDIEVRLPLQTH